MIITDLEFDLGLVRGSVPMVGDGVRSPGLHLTDIIHSLQVASGIVDDSATPEQLAVYGAMGFMWERVIENGMALSCQSDRYIRPGEVTLDGIAGSPDLLDLEQSIVIDTKALFKSSAKLADLQRNFWKWLVQLKGYCHMVGWTTAELWVLPVCGNWKPPMVGPPVRKRLEFSRVELVDNWSMILTHAREKGWLP